MACGGGKNTIWVQEKKKNHASSIDCKTFHNISKIMKWNFTVKNDEAIFQQLPSVAGKVTRIILYIYRLFIDMYSDTLTNVTPHLRSLGLKKNPLLTRTLNFFNTVAAEISFDSRVIVATGNK